MSQQTVEKRVDEIALLLVMVDENDAGGLDAIAEICGQVADLCASVDEYARLASAASFIKEKRSAVTGGEFRTLAESFSSAATAFLNKSASAKFPNELEISGTGDDLGPNYDSEFLVEFIERHTMLLDEFEGTINEFRCNANSADEERHAEFIKHVKSYLHGLKGDAGAVGLAGIEKTTHSLEDALLQHPAYIVIEALLSFKEWVVACMAAYAKKDAPPVLAAEYIPQLLKLCDATIDPNAVQTSASHPMPTAEKKDSTTAAANQERYQISSDLQLLSEFIVEAEDHLGGVENLLLETSVEDLSLDNVGTIFRAVHSVKGASAYFNLLEINKTSHALENLLDEVRSGKRIFDTGLVGLVFSYVDLQKQLIASAKVAVSHDGFVTCHPGASAFLDDIQNYISGAPSVGRENTAEKQDVAIATPLANETPLAAVSTPANLASTNSDRAKKESGDALHVKHFIKVDTARLDSLIDSIGEMVIYSSMLVRSCRELLGDNEAVLKTTHQVEKFSRDLQDIGMSMRLDPIRGLFQKMSRLVWDTSKKLGKNITFAMKGEDTELDRNVIDKLADPLMHMVRNAIDHGIEGPEERAASGKPAAGTIELTAYQAGGSIHIEIRDDGRGIHPEKIRAKAVEKGIIAPDQKLSLQETYLLLFAPGFSTAAQVTDISGRGVGMDVVRNNIEAMRGEVHIESEVGKGSVFHIELPLTLAIMEGVEAVVGPERFIIPTLSILEFMKPTKEMISKAVGKAETFHFRGNYLPLYRLSDLYALQSQHTDVTEATVVIVENGRELVALMVDDIVTSCQTVIKNLGAMFERSNGFAGCAVMPNGDIGLILDVRSVVQLARRNYREQLSVPEIPAQEPIDTGLH